MNEVGQCNPFEVHIKEWFERTGEAGGINEWAEAGPYFSVCPEKALAFACGDEAMATVLLDGTVGLHEVPDELLSSEMVEQRLQWLRTRVAEVTAQREERERAWHAEIKARFAKLNLVDGPTRKVSPEEEENH